MKCICAVEKNNGEGGRGEGERYTGGSSPYHPPPGGDSALYHTLTRARDLVYEICVLQKSFVPRCIVPREPRGHCRTLAAALSIHTRIIHLRNVIMGAYIEY